MKNVALAIALALAAAACGAPGPAARGSLGTLVTHDHVVQVEQTADGVRYSIETRDGELVASDLTREQLETLAPTAAKSLETGTARRALDARVLIAD